MKKIKSVEEAIEMIELCSIKEGEATEIGDFKTNNKYARYEKKCLKYLYEHNQLQELHVLLRHENHRVRLSAAYALLPLYEEDSKKALSEIANGDYGFSELSAKMLLRQWNAGELHFPWQPNFGEKPSEESNKKIEEVFLSKTSYFTVEKAEKNGFSPEILRLSQIFGCPPTNDTELRNEDSGFYVKLNQESKELIVNVNMFVNPYTQDVIALYQERLERFKAFEHVATFSAERPSKLGFMKFLLTIPYEKATDHLLMQIKDTIYSIYNEWKPNETLVCFKAEYNGAICYFEGEWWCPTRAVIMGRNEYERYDFSDEMKYDEAMWDIVQGEYDASEDSDSFALINCEEFQLIWDNTKHQYTPKPY